MAAPNSTETELLSRINQGLPEDASHRYHELMTKRRAGALTPEEHRELLRLTDTDEALQAERARYLADLARLRGVSLSVLVESLHGQDSSVPPLEPGGRGDF